GSGRWCPGAHVRPLVRLAATHRHRPIAKDALAVVRAGENPPLDHVVTVNWFALAETCQHRMGVRAEYRIERGELRAGGNAIQRTLRCAVGSLRLAVGSLRLAVGSLRLAVGSHVTSNAVTHCRPNTVHGLVVADRSHDDFDGLVVPELR